jgi:hypothetical protein
MKRLWMIALVVAAVAGCGGGSGPTATTTEDLVVHPGQDPCRVECHAEFDDCNESCASDRYPWTCMCLCQNLHAICIGGCNGGGTPPLRECPPPDDGQK